MLFASGGWLCRSLIERRRRCGQILHLGCILPSPETGDPHPPAVNRLPVPGNPPPTRRHVPPAPADPEEVVRLVIPGPVTGNPLNIITSGLLVRRKLFDRVRRLLRDDRPRRGLNARWERERLMDWPARLNFGTRHVARRGRWRVFRIGGCGQIEGKRRG